jgi:hypothetical protein
MESVNLFTQLVDLFRKTAKSHHEAYIETDGYHPDWPMWYAEHLHEKLTQILNAEFTLSELIYLIVLVDKEHALNAPGSDWAAYYTRFFINRYQPAASEK